MGSRLPVARLPAVGLCLLLAIWSARDADLAYSAAHRTDPVFRWWGGDSVAQLRQSEARMADPAFVAHHAADVAGQARAALRAEPLDARALRLLAVVTSLAAPEQAMALANLSEQVTRRDLPTQLMLIEAAVAKGDIADALAHYDRALSVYNEAQPLLFPVLAAAIEDQPIRAELTAYARRPWFAGFVGFAITNNAALDAVIALLLEAGGRMATADHDRLASSLLQHLVAQGDYARARAFALRLPGAGAGLLRTWHFAGTALDPRFAPLSWRLASDEAITADADGSGWLRLTAEPGANGQAAERVSYWQPGDYALTQTVSYEPGTAPAHLSWEAYCATPDGEKRFWQQAIPQQGGRITYRSHIHVPADCGVQHWRLGVAADDAQSSSAVALQLLSLAAVTP